MADTENIDGQKAIRQRIEAKIASLIPAKIHPNHLSSFRLAVILLLPVAEVYSISPKLIFWLVMLAGITDALDGITARQRHQITPLGSFLDPLADKLFALVSLVVLYRHQLITKKIIIWMLLLESHLVIIPVLSFLHHTLSPKKDYREFYIRPNFFGKLKTTFLIVGFSLLFMASAYSLPSFFIVGRWSINIGLVLSGMAVIYYIMDWVHDKY